MSGEFKLRHILEGSDIPGRLNVMRKTLIAACLMSGLLWGQESTDRPFWRTVVMGTHGMVAAEHPLEALAGFEVLRGGGNAIDAAVAAFYMTGVVEQHQAGIGGDAVI